MAGMDLSANRSGKNSDIVTPKLSKSKKAELRYPETEAKVNTVERNRETLEKIPTWPGM